MPASSSSSAIRNASSGVSGAGFITIEQPASSAGASFDIVTNCGTFHGTIAATTPTGSRAHDHVAAEHTSTVLLPVVLLRDPMNEFSIIHGSRRLREVGERDRRTHLVGDDLGHVIMRAA